MKPKGVILSGGPDSVPTRRAAGAARCLRAGVPVFGICYGEQTMAYQLGGEVEAGHHRNSGARKWRLTESPFSRASGRSATNIRSG